jgi:3-oxoadipate enol-lactonase
VDREGENALPYVRTDDVTLYCEVDGEGQPVTVLAHGRSNNRNELAAFMPIVPGTKVRFDVRGHGRSGGPATGYAFADYARDVDAVASAYRATVAVGTSLGAGALGNLVCRIPDRFDRMVWLLPAGLDGPFSLAGRYRAIADDIRGTTPEELLESMVGDPRRVAELARTPWRLEVDRVLWQHDDPDALARAIHGAVSDHPIHDREALRSVRIPTLILTIEGDDLHPAELGRMFAGLLPNAELIALEGQHALFERLPEVVARVSAFIGGNGSGRDDVADGVSEEPSA